MILNNPFHILGLVANSDKHEETRRQSQIKRYLEVGKPLSFQDDLYFPGCRRNAITMERAISGIQDAHDRIGPGLFWFTDGGPTDQAGLHKTRSGDLYGAIEVWNWVEHKPVELAYASSLNNLGTACMLSALVGKSPGSQLTNNVYRPRDHLLRGIRAKARLIGNLSGPELCSFCASFSDEIAARNPNEIADIFAESLEKFTKEAALHQLEVDTRTLIAALGSHGSRSDRIKDRFGIVPRQELERSLRKSKTTYKDNPSMALAAGKLLVESAREQLKALAEIISESEFAYMSLADRVADELVDAAVCYFNYAKQDSESAEIASSILPLERFAVEVACGSSTRTRAEDNLKATKKIIKGRAMQGVRAELKAWLEGAVEFTDGESDSFVLVAFLRRALGDSGSLGDSAIGLLDAFRRKGIQVFGPEFRASGEMVHLGTVLCMILVTSAMSAYAGTANKSTERKAARFIFELNHLFRAVSMQEGQDDASFLIDDELAAGLKTQVFAVRHFGLSGARASGYSLESEAYMHHERRLEKLAGTHASRPKVEANSERGGCLSVIAFLIGVLTLLAHF